MELQINISRYSLIIGMEKVNATHTVDGLRSKNSRKSFFKVSDKSSGQGS
jgi:hypothetical protein